MPGATTNGWPGADALAEPWYNEILTGGHPGDPSAEFRAMPVVRLVFRCGSQPGPGAGEAAALVRAVDPRHDAKPIVRAIASGLEPADFVPRVRGVLAELESRPGRCVASWLATVDESPVGLVALVAAGETPFVRHSISWLLVSADARRRGIGRALVAAAVAAARSRGAREVWAETRADWTAAIAFWKAVGFEPVA